MHPISTTAEARRAELDEIRRDLVERARNVGPVLAAHAAQGDVDRRLPDASLRALAEAGLLGVWVPRRLGGFEADTRTLIEVTAELARHDPAAAWVTSLMNACSWTVSLFPGKAQEEILARGPKTPLCGIFAPTAKASRTADGIRVSGTWAYASGCQHAEWAVVATPIFAEGSLAPTIAMVVIPMKDIRIEDTWRNLGMRGTGSHTMVAKDVFVPEERILPLLGPDGAMEGVTRTEHQEETLYRTQLGGWGALTIIGPIIGMAKAALDLVLAKVPGQRLAYTTCTDQSQLVSTQLQIAEAATKIDSGELHILRSANDLDEAALAGVRLDLRRRARIRQDQGYGVRCLREGFDELVQVMGSSGLADTAPFARIVRDFGTASLHGIVRPGTTAELYGKVLCGVDPGPFSPFF